MADSHLNIVNDLLSRSGIPGPIPERALVRIAGDGSDRQFYRIEYDEQPLVAVFPGSETEKDFSEAKSSYLIGKHLYEKGVPVPVIFAYDRDHGVLIVEDCGDLHLHDVLVDDTSLRDIDRLYQKVIDGLILLQVEGKEGFDREFCWDTSRYDINLMLTRESGYFLSSFCHDYLGLIPDHPEVALEFERLARRAARLPGDYLLHRDFQSRNILVQEKNIRIIDFQGARFGPLGYDLASLLIDPYAGLTFRQEEVFLEYYLNEISTRIAINQQEFRSGYYLLALQRSFQILGAFAYLSQIKGKSFFRKYINPALAKLHSLLGDERGEDYPRLRGLVSDISSRMGVPVESHPYSRP